MLLQFHILVALLYLVYRIFVQIADTRYLGGGHATILADLAQPLADFYLINHCRHQLVANPPPPRIPPRLLVDFFPSLPPSAALGLSC